MTFSNPITGGQGTLVRPAIKSPDYVPGVSGWSINRDGTAEFNDLTIRGTFNGNDFILNVNGFFLYSGTPAAGNLVAAAAPVAGVDEFGNSYGAGFTSDGTDLFSQPINSQLLDGAVNFWQPGTEATYNPGGIGVTSLSGNDSFRLTLNPPFPLVGGTFPIIELYTSSASFASTDEIQMISSLVSFFPNDAPNTHITVNGTEQGWGPVDFVARQTNTGTTTTTEAVALTSSSITFQASRAYRITMHGLVQSTVAADRVDVRVRKHDTTGTALLDSGQNFVLPAASVQLLCDMSVVVITNSTPPTDVLVMTYQRTAGTGNASIIASATNPAYLFVEDIGAASDFPSARLLT